MSYLLDVVLFAPLIGFLVLLLLPKDNPELIRRATLTLSLVVFLPAAGAVLLLLFPKSRSREALIFALCFSVLDLVVALPLCYWLGFHTSLGPVGIWWGVAAGLGCAAVLLVWRVALKTRAH